MTGKNQTQPPSERARYANTEATRKQKTAAYITITLSLYRITLDLSTLQRDYFQETEGRFLARACPRIGYSA